MFSNSLRGLCVLLVAVLVAGLILANSNGIGQTSRRTSRQKRVARRSDADILRRMTPNERAEYFTRRHMDDLNQKRADAEKKQRRDALKQVGKLKAKLKKASAGDETAELLCRIGASYLRGNLERSSIPYFQQVLDKYPRTQAARRARIHLFDVLLYEKFDLEGARKLVSERDGDNGRTPANIESGIDKRLRRRVLLAPKQVLDEAVPLNEGSIEANEFAREALIAFLDGDELELEARFRDVRPQTKATHIWHTLKNWRQMRQRVFSDPDVVSGESDVLWFIRLSDLHQASGDYSTALALLNAAAKFANAHPTKLQLSYILFRRAQCTYRLHATSTATDRDLKDASKDFLLARKTSPQARWAPDALFLAGNVYWNQMQDYKSAIVTWKILLKNYATSPLAERAAYHTGALYQLHGETKKAKQAFVSFREKYPKSELVSQLNSDGLSSAIKVRRR